MAVSSVIFPNQADVLNHTIRVTPVVGTATVSATAGELVAGSSRLSGRTCMFIKNESTDTRIRIGGSSLSYKKGFPVEPGATMRLDFDPNIAVAIYAISEGAEVRVDFMEY